MLKLGNKGIVLFIVLMTVILVIILGNIILGLMFGQNRFTQHKVGRIQAYYAGLAGIRYASEMLRTNKWALPTDDGPPYENYYCGLLCRKAGCTSSILCSTPTYNDIPVDDKLPGTINAVVIKVYELRPNNTRAITASVDYATQ
ncbi:MAG: hypothetical protein WC417_02110 [Candidatus Omnitrophota bacterium]|jgi:Tfp pilus assembly protein PilX